jgi:hypothetical protein
MRIIREKGTEKREKQGTCFRLGVTTGNRIIGQITKCQSFQHLSVCRPESEGSFVILIYTPLPYRVILKMEAVCYSETCVTT